MTADEPKVCGDVSWCGLPAGHGQDIDPMGGHRVTADGVHLDMDEITYHADPVPGRSLSSTGARRILPPGCPAKFDYVRKHGEPDRAVWDVGRAAHTKILGRGAGVVVIPDHITASNGAWSTKEAKQAVADARAAGLTPVKPDVAEQIDGMAEAVLADPDARRLLEPGASEVALFWTDPDSGVTCRTLLDKLPPVGPDGQLQLADLKTVRSAEPDALRRAMGDHGYHQQAEWCVSGAEQLGLCDVGMGSMTFIAVEKDPPHVVTLYRPDPMAWMRATERNRAARHIYAACGRAGRWPGYVDELTGWGSERVIELALLPWLENEEITV